jgi:hypothetical protein
VTEEEGRKTSVRRAIRPVPSRFLLSRRYRSKTEMPGIADEPTQSAQAWPRAGHR